MIGDICLGLFAILFPPFPVWIKRGLCSVDSLINIALCMLGFVPGLLHSWYIIASTPDGYDEYEVVASDLEAGNGPRRDSRVTYYYVSQPGPQLQAPLQQGQQQQVNYGTVGGAQGQSQGQDVAADAEVPPSYSDAVRGDNKVQR